MKSLRFFVLLIGLLVVSIGIFQFTHTAEAQTSRSQVCTILNGRVDEGIAVQFAGTFYAGEVIEVTATLLPSSQPATFQLEVSPPPEIVAGPASVPGTLSYTLPSSGFINFIYRASVPVRFEVVCNPPSSDTDADGVLDGADYCPATTIPEGVPTEELNPNHWALIDGDTTFDTVTQGKGNGPGRSYTTTDTAGCSCEQIIAAQGLGEGHIKHGCSISAMDDWVAHVGNDN